MLSRKCSRGRVVKTRNLLGNSRIGSILPTTVGEVSPFLDYILHIFRDKRNEFDSTFEVKKFNNRES